MDDTIRKILERPFAPEVLKQRQGPNGKTLTYVEIQHHVDRLNEAFAGAWSWEVTRREQIEDQILVEGRLTAGGVVKTGLGGSVITRRRDDNRPVSIADDTKKAEADAIKRSCRLLGIGSHLYTEDDGDAPAATASRAVPVPAASTVRPTATPAAASLPPRNRITQKQLNALLAICRSRGWEDKTFRDRIKLRFGCTLDFLTRTQASDLIGELDANGSSNGNGDDRQPGQDG